MDLQIWQWIELLCHVSAHVSIEAEGACQIPRQSTVGQSRAYMA
ncbi:hypothetical protein [Cognatishimia sp. WU-CL00825]